MSKIKFGIWGFGRMGAAHGKYYAMEQDKFELVAACDIDEEKLNRAKSEHNCAVYSDHKAFLSNPAMELVVIVTLSLDHTRHAIEALESGKYVLLDKPIAITDDELETLRQADKKYPGKLFILHNLRFEPVFEAVQQQIARGVLGEINTVKLRRHQLLLYLRSDWQTLLEYGGGLLNNWGNHEIDHAVQLLGCHPVQVFSQLWHVSSGGNGDDHVKIILKGGNNRLADLEISNNVTVPKPYCTVYGQRGSLMTDQKNGVIRLKYLDPDFKIPKLSVELNTSDYKQQIELPWIEESVAIEYPDDMWEYIDRKLIKYIYGAIKDGIPSPIKNSDAFETIRIIQEVKKQNPQFNWIK